MRPKKRRFRPKTLSVARASARASYSADLASILTTTSALLTFLVVSLMVAPSSIASRSAFLPSSVMSHFSSTLNSRWSLPLIETTILCSSSSTLTTFPSANGVGQRRRHRQSGNQKGDKCYGDAMHF